MGRGSRGAAGLAPLGRAGYAHVPDANTGGQPIQTTTVILTCVYDGLRRSSRRASRLNVSRLTVSARTVEPSPTALMASMTASVSYPSSRREFTNVFRLCANAAFTTAAKAGSSSGERRASCFVRNTTTADPTSGRGRKQLADTVNAVEMSAAYCPITDQTPYADVPALATS